MNYYSLYNVYDFDLDNDVEIAWVHDPMVLVWPPHNLFKISPFAESFTLAERLNANTRLMILVGFLAYHFFHQMNNTNGAFYALFFIFIQIIQQGIAYMNMIQMQTLQSTLQHAIRNIRQQHSPDLSAKIKQQEREIALLQQKLQQQSVQQFPQIQFPKYFNDIF
jgi:hypothetical protein